MSKIEDGGPAFPGGEFEPQHGGSNDREPWNAGMTLRDYLAGQALVGIGTWMPNGTSLSLTTLDNLRARAEWAYAQADAMIVARKGGEA